MNGPGAVETRLDDWVFETNTPRGCSKNSFAWRLSKDSD